MTTPFSRRANRAGTARVASLVLAGLLAGLAVHAEEAEPVISSASRYGQSTYEAPASVAVITRDAGTSPPGEVNPTALVAALDRLRTRNTAYEI